MEWSLLEMEVQLVSMRLLEVPDRTLWLEEDKNALETVSFIASYLSSY